MSASRTSAARCWRGFWCAASVAAALGWCPGTAWTLDGDAAPDAVDLTTLSLEELTNMRVTVVSRQPERWWSAPYGVDVVTADDVRRSGARNLPDVLRLATGVHVGQPSARSWAVSIRGMNVLAANKVSVVMDGRSLFTPFFSGVQWDAQDTLIEDVDRVEVVRGPLGSLWGAFAVNGFIQVVTKPSWSTQGWLASAGAGTEDPGFFALRYGGMFGDRTAYRAYARYFQTDWTRGPGGEHAQPATDFLQAGFRTDRRGGAGAEATLQGDYYTNDGLPLDRVQTRISGANLLGRWRRPLADGSEVQVDGYLDHTYREIPGVFEERRNTASASVKYRRKAGAHSLLFGSDVLLSADEIGNMGPAQLLPGERTIHTIGAYVHDAVALSPSVSLVLGAKAEHSSFAGWEVQPTARLAWAPSPRTTLWAAVSRAVRTPVRVDEDLVIRIGETLIFEANDDFRTETALAYEMGGRTRFSDVVTLAVSGFAYRYDHLRSTEPASSAPLPLTFLNTLEADSIGAEATVMYRPASRLHVKVGYRVLDLDFSTDPGSGHTGRGRAEGNDPTHVGIVAAHLSLPRRFEVDVFLRHVSDLPDPPLDGYTTADARLGWRPVESFDVSLIGRNLADRQHAEFVTTNSLNEEVSRSFAVRLTWRTP